MASDWFDEEELGYPELLLTPFEQLDLQITRMQIHKIVKRGRLTLEEERDLIYLSQHEQNILERGYNRGYSKQEEIQYNE